MADGLPPISLELETSGTPYVEVGQTPAADFRSLVELAPQVMEPQWARILARAVNHLAHGYQYEVIQDPAAFEQTYRAEYAAEDADEEVGPGISRLHNYGMPEFSEIQIPSMENGTLVFFARHMRMGVPYRVEAVGADSAPTYTPLDLAPED